MLVHVFGKQAPTSGPLLLLYPLMLVDLISFPFLSFSIEALVCTMLFLALNANPPEIHMTDYCYYSNQVNVTSPQGPFMATLHEVSRSRNQL